MNDSAILETQSRVEYAYAGDRDHTYVIPAGIELRAGRCYCIFGISGSGKSTLLTLLASLRLFRRGDIHYRFGEDRTFAVSAENWRRQAGPALWRHIGFAFQRPELIKTLTVRQNLELVGCDASEGIAQLFATGEGPKEDEWAAIERSRVWRISGGQTQRVGLIRAFGKDQSLIFLDEPTNNLDRDNRRGVARFLRSQQADRAIVIVSHDESFLDLLDVDTTFEIDEEIDDSGHKTRLLRSA